MTASGRIVVDTNVLVSALLSPRSLPRRAFDAARRSGDLLASAATLRELILTLRKPKLAPYLAPAEREAFLRLLGQSLTVGSIRRCTILKPAAFLAALDEGNT